MLAFSEITTPDALSMQDDYAEDPISTNHDDDSGEDSEEKRNKKPYASYVVRLKNEPKYKRAKNKFDTYLTKTSLRAIKFTENKKRWQRIIKNDLYSKTVGRGIP